MAKDGRLHLRVTQPLADQIRAYAARHHTSVTQVVTDYFIELLKKEETPKVPEVEQV